MLRSPLLPIAASLLTSVYSSVDWRSGFGADSWCLGASWQGFSVLKNPPANAGDSDSIAGSGRCPEEENGNPLQYSAQEVL